MFKKSLLILIPILFLTAIVSAQILTWNTASTYPITIRDATVIYYNGYVYSLGGRTTGEGVGTHAIDNVYYAAVNTDGSIGAWTATTALPGKRAAGGAYGYNGNLYFWGGWKEDYVTVNTCYYAPINPDGSIGSWVTSSVTIPDSSGGQPQMDSFGRGVLAFNDTLYILGGEDNLGTIQSSCYYSKIQGGGDYGSWTATTILPINVWFHGAMIYTGTSATYIYQLGGLTGGQANIYYNTINPDGSLGATWQLAINALTIALYDPGCAFAVDSIFIIGGLNGYTSLDKVQQCRVNPSTGNIDEAFEETALPAARARTSAVGYTANGEKYILVVGGGGYYPTDPVYADCWYSHVAIPTKSYPWSLYE